MSKVIRIRFDYRFLYAAQCKFLSLQLTFFFVQAIKVDESVYVAEVMYIMSNANFSIVYRSQAIL